MKREPKPVRDAWIQGFAVALAEVHRVGHHSSVVVDAARCARLTRRKAKAAGVADFDLRELRAAGVP